MRILRVPYNFGCRALYNLPWQESVGSHEVQCNIPTFEALLRKNTYLLNEVESLTTYGCSLWCSQIVYVHPYSLNTTTAFYLMAECFDVAVFIWGRVHATTHPYFTWPWLRLDSVSYSGYSVLPNVMG